MSKMWGGSVIASTKKIKKDHVRREKKLSNKEVRTQTFVLSNKIWLMESPRSLAKNWMSDKICDLADKARDQNKERFNREYFNDFSTDKYESIGDEMRRIYENVLENISTEIRKKEEGHYSCVVISKTVYDYLKFLNKRTEIRIAAPDKLFGIDLKYSEEMLSDKFILINRRVSKCL